MPVKTSRSAIAFKIGTFVRLHARRSLVETDNIFQLGFVNSLFAIQLVLFVEKEFGISVEDGDLEAANFMSINAISRFVDRKLRSSRSVAQTTDSPSDKH